MGQEGISSAAEEEEAEDGIDAFLPNAALLAASDALLPAEAVARFRFFFFA